jgi:23S rRNA pseudouridine1911/1915/1917 synthase
MVKVPNSSSFNSDAKWLSDEFNDDLSDEFNSTFDATPIAFQLNADSCGERLDKALAQFIPQFSRSRLQQWIAQGHVLVDGMVGRSKMIMLGEEHIVVQPQPAPHDDAYKPEAMRLDIVFEDEALLVINKPAGLVVHPAAGNWSGTLLNGLLHYCPALSGVPRAGIVHRLDKDTSGLMVAAKTLEAQTDLVRQLQARSVQREYWALVWGKPNLSGVIELPIARHPRDRIKMAVSEHALAKPALTRFKRLAVGALDGKAVSLLECQLETGRTHQIRVHMAHLGFPLVGDGLYGKSHLARYFPRQALQARRLGLTHPVKSNACSWQIDLAQDFAGLLTQAGLAPHV